MILLGFTSVKSFEKKGFYKLKNFAKSYVIDRFQRIVLPVIIIFLFSSGLAYLKSNLIFRKLNLIGYLPFTGPGNYFISIILQFIIMFPILFKLYKYSPTLLLILGFGVDLTFQLVAPKMTLFMIETYYYSASILRYLSAITLGMWIAQDNYSFKKVNWFIWIGVIGSTIYLFVSFTKGYVFPFFLQNWGTQNLFSFFYPLLIVIMTLNLWPNNNSLTNRIISKIARLSFHIFLIQILYFSSITKFSTAAFFYSKIPGLFLKSMVNLAACIILALLLRDLGNKSKYILNKNKLKQTWIFK